MSKFAEIFQDLVVIKLEQLYQFTMQFGPKIALAIIIFLIGWVCAILLKKIVSKLLKALGLDVLSEKAGFKHFLEKGGIQKKPSALAGLVFYWIIIFSALVTSFNTLELNTASQLIQQTLSYMPKFIVALILLVVGTFLSQFVGRLVEATSRLAGINFYRALGKTAHYFIMALVIMICLEYLGVAKTSIIIIFGVVPLIVSLLFIVGGREVIASILSGRLLMKEYKQGDTIEFDSISGQIKIIDFVVTKINVKEGEIIIPNSELAKKIIKKV
ncbi:MAG: mechanosensitive ion channel [Candidatus Omnitrophica bacterium]|nr:mechanosensitive ion channel [Candidatus Omnitrophota bacterium]